MKYLRLYEEVRIELKDYINYDMLNDLYDLSLELIDNGFVLCIGIYYNEQFKNNPNFHYKICSIIYDYEPKFKWDIDSMVISKKKFEKDFIYVFHFKKENDAWVSDPHRSTETHDIEDIIKNMYPKEDIKYKI